MMPLHPNTVRCTSCLEVGLHMQQWTVLLLAAVTGMLGTLDGVSKGILADNADF